MYRPPASNDVWVVAVGYYVNTSSSWRPLAARWVNSGSNDLSLPPAPSGNDTLLFGVTIDSQAEIRAVGFNGSYTGTGNPFFERWNSTSGWLTPYVGLDNGSLHAVAQVPTDPNTAWMKDIWAAGKGASGSLSPVEHNDAIDWQPVSHPNSNSLYGIAVNSIVMGGEPTMSFSASEAWAVGNYTSGGVQQTLVLHYTPPAVPGAPRYTISNYVETTDETVLKQMGCNAQARGETGIHVLDFGAPRNWSAATPNATPTYGTQLTGPPPVKTVTIPKIETMVANFADGLAIPTCAPSGPPPLQPRRLMVAIGTSNDIEDPPHNALNYGHGIAWGTMVAQANQYSIDQGYSDRITFAGAMDIEQGSNPTATPSGGTATPVWGNPTPVTDWINGYVAASGGYDFYNFGSCDGCDPNPAGGAMAYGWTPAAVYNVSYGIYLHAYPLPEIYYFQPGSDLAEQWRRTSLAGAGMSFGIMKSHGVMTEDQPTTSNSPDQGWNQLWQALNFDPTGRTAYDPPFSTQITQKQK